jgi:hypothetical protein
MEAMHGGMPCTDGIIMQIACLQRSPAQQSKSERKSPSHTSQQGPTPIAFSINSKNLQRS